MSNALGGSHFARTKLERAASMMGRDSAEAPAADATAASTASATASAETPSSVPMSAPACRAAGEERTDWRVKHSPGWSIASACMSMHKRAGMGTC